jgi:hypothetical protein
MPNEEAMFMDAEQEANENTADDIEASRMQADEDCVEWQFNEEFPID